MNEGINWLFIVTALELNDSSIYDVGNLCFVLMRTSF